MPPILATAARLVRAKTQTLEHGAFLLKGVIIAFATAETIAEVLIVLVAGICLLRVDATLSVRRRVKAEGTGARRRIPDRTAIAGKVSLVEYLDKGMFAVALHGARVADTGGRIVRVARIRWRRVAGDTGKDALAKGAEWFGAALDTLPAGLVAEESAAGETVGHYVWERLACIGLKLHLISNKAVRSELLVFCFALSGRDMEMVDPTQRRFGSCRIAARSSQFAPLLAERELQRHPQTEVRLEDP